MQNKDIVIKTDGDILEDYVKIIKENSKELLEKNYEYNILLQNAIQRGIQAIQGNISSQTMVDLCSIALTLLVKREGIKNDSNRS